MGQDVVQMKGTQVERNLSRLSLIAASNRVAKTATSWARELQMDVLGIQRIECLAGRNQVIPHGIDNDLLVGLINAYVQQGLPDDRLVRFNVASLLKLAGLETNGNNYQALEASLDRLKSAQFVVRDSWWDQQYHRFVETKFSIVESVRRIEHYRDGELIGCFQATNLLEVQLAAEITNSIRSGHLRVLDPEIYSRLDQSLARTLYRTLEEARTPVGAVPVRQYSLLLHDWATHLGIQNTAPDRIRRALQPAHDNLVATGYLNRIEYQGKGRSQIVFYYFGEVAPAVSATSVALLTTRGIARERAVLWAQNRSEEKLLEAIRIYEGVMARSSKKVINPAGLLLSIIEHPESYPELSSSAALPFTPRLRSKTNINAEPTAQPPLPGMSAQERCDTFLKVVKMFKLNSETLAQVADNIVREKVGADDVGRVQSCLVRLHMNGAPMLERQSVLSELL